MVCVDCKWETKVINSREGDGNTVRRRRECLKCGGRYTTFEITAEQYLAVLDTWRAIGRLEDAQYSIGSAMVHARSATDALRDVAEGTTPALTEVGLSRLRAILGTPQSALGRPDE